MKVRQIAVVILAAAVAGVALAATARVDGRQAAAPPRSLVVAEGLAEDIQADLDARNWTMARTRLAELEKNRVALKTVCSVGDTVVIDGEALVLVPGRA